MTQAVNLAALARQLQTGGVVPRTAMADSDTGKVDFFMRATAPSGWVEANGGTIGNAASGGTLRANADTVNLFNVLWALNATDFPLQTSVGGASTRGASAAADFAANRRIVVRDMRAEFIRGLDNGRGVDTSRVLGSAQGHALQEHSHSVDSYVSGTNGPSGRPQEGTAGSTDSFQTLTSGSTGTFASETRPRNIALLVCVKL